MKRLITVQFLALMFMSLHAQSGIQYSDGLVHGTYRTYMLYIPSAYVPGKAVPLLLSLHGFTESAEYQNSLADFKPIADTANFIIAMPDGMPNPQMYGFVGWNIFPISSGVDDPGFLAKLIDTISNRYTIDRNRIYLTGHSAGAIMSYELACSMSNRIAAIAPVNGFMFPPHVNNCRPGHPVPVMEIHGTADPVRSWDGIGPVSQAVPMDTLIRHWVRINGCSPIPTIDTLPDPDKNDKSWVYRYTYSGGTAGSSVELYKVINGGHTWPGSKVLEPYGNTNKDFNACASIWRFLSKYRLNILNGTGQEKDTGPSLRLYPNPFTDAINIGCEMGSTLTDIRIHNLLGQLLYRHHGSVQESNLSIDTSKWNPGIYLLTINSGNDRLCRKIIKQ